MEKIGNHMIIKNFMDKKIEIDDDSKDIKKNIEIKYKIPIETQRIYKTQVGYLLLVKNAKDCLHIADRETKENIKEEESFFIDKESIYRNGIEEYSSSIPKFKVDRIIKDLDNYVKSYIHGSKN